MSAMDNPAIVLAQSWIFTVKFLDMMFDSIDQFVLDLTLNQQVIWRNTGLSSIDQFPPGNAFGGTVEVNISIHNTRAFPAQF